MVSSGLLRRVALVRIDVSEEPGASFIRATKIGELGTTQAAKQPTYVAKKCSSETSVLTRATRRNNPEDTILQGVVRFYVAMDIHNSYSECTRFHSWSGEKPAMTEFS
jgi:hypothetical protein